MIRGVGLIVVAVYAGLIGWLFSLQPRTVTEAIGSVAAGIGAYSIDTAAFADGVAYFRREQFVEARAAFSRADPAARDARTQFYVAYSYYRQGWHHAYRDDGLYREGLIAVDRALGLAPGGRLIIEDGDLQMHSADELKAALADGLNVDASDFNPLRLFETRK